MLVVQVHQVLVVQLVIRLKFPPIFDPSQCKIQPIRELADEVVEVKLCWEEKLEGRRAKCWYSISHSGPRFSSAREGTLLELSVIVSVSVSFSSVRCQEDFPNMRRRDSEEEEDPVRPLKKEVRNVYFYHLLIILFLI